MKNAVGDVLSAFILDLCCEFYEFARRNREKGFFYFWNKRCERFILIVRPNKDNEAKGARREVLLMLNVLVNG